MREFEQRPICKELALISILALGLYAGALGSAVYFYGERIKGLRQKCIAERIIDINGYPGSNFRLEVKDQCDTFIVTNEIRRAKGMGDYGSILRSPGVGW